MLGSVRLALFSLAALLGAASFGAAAAAPPTSGDVIVVPIEGTVDEGMAHLVQRAVAEANDQHAAAIVLDINTPGGLVSAAFEIRDAIFAAKVPDGGVHLATGLFGRRADRAFRAEDR